MTLHRKRTRLPANQYLGRKAYFVTICCDGRRPHLAQPEYARSIQGLLIECAAHRSFRLHAYCLMTDHLHVLAEGSDLHSDLLEFVRLFKQRSAFGFRKSADKALWEMGFYDYVLRPSDRIADIAAYIWWNPVRKGICKEPKDYPFSGSQTIDWIIRSRLGTVWVAPWKAKEGKTKEEKTEKEKAKERV